MHYDILYLILRVLDNIVTISCGCILYCGCCNLFCNVWVLLCVGVLLMCVLVCTVFYIVCTVFFVLFLLCIFILICFFCTSVRTARPSGRAV